MPIKYRTLVYQYHDLLVKGLTDHILNQPQLSGCSKISISDRVCVVLGVERDGVVVDHLLADLDLGATWEDGGS